MLSRYSTIFVLIITSILATGCVTTAPYDYSAFKQSRPRSILVLPPVNNSPDVNATYSVYSQITYPLAESGYYVFPVALVNETFKQNGLTTPVDIHAVSLAKLQEIFGADSALYITISNYGATYTIINSEAIVAAKAKLIDLKSGALLWEGSASASSNESQNNNSGGLAGLLISAIVKQIVNNVSNASHQVANVASQRLLNAGHSNGILYGPRSTRYGTD